NNVSDPDGVAPLYVDAGNGNFHLSANSPLLDLGDPAAPAIGRTDFDGDARAIDATPACMPLVPRRDIGFDEFVPAPATGCGPTGGGGTATPAGTTPQTGAPATS